MTRALAVAATTLATMLAGCSVLVEPSTDVRCEVGGTCPGGLVCMAVPGEDFGRCGAPCTPDGNETCNATDDDCDGRIDEGNEIEGVGGPGVDTPEETFDQDDDGFNKCGTQGCVAPDVACEVDPGEVDCDDDDPTVNPRAMERCDGTDNNCDGDAFPLGEPDASCRAPRDDLCGGGQICEPDRGCIPLDCNSGRPCTACGVRQICIEGRCEDTECDSAVCEGMNQWCGSGPECRDKLANGEECNRNIECVSGFCDTGRTLGLPTAAAGLCFEPCCADSDCTGSEFCYGPGTGARSCIRPRPGLEASTGRTAVGAGGAGAACSSGAECRSGRCDGAAGCFSACGQSSECPAACGLTDEGLGCRAGGDLGASCASDSECAIPACGANCLTQSCRTNDSCPPRSGRQGFCDPVAADAGSGLQAALVCTYAPAAEPMANNVSHGASCDRDYCAAASDCCITLFGVCVETFATGCNTGTCLSGRCTSSCCTDESCPGTDVCRPQSRSIEGGTFFPMYCVPPA